MRSALIDHILSDIPWFSQERYVNSVIITFPTCIFQDVVDLIQTRLEMYFNDELRLSKLQVSNVNVVKFEGYKVCCTVNTIHIHKHKRKNVKTYVLFITSFGIWYHIHRTNLQLIESSESTLCSMS